MSKTIICQGFQSTLPHGERLTNAFINDIIINVSIHAPTRGATALIYVPCGKCDVSIHAPTRGATSQCSINQGTDTFQSTLPHGERLKDGCRCFESVMFQSTLPHGERQFLLCLLSRWNRFQSTLPHGERLTFIEIDQVEIGFNPRSHTGSDHIYNNN